MNNEIQETKKEIKDEFKDKKQKSFLSGLWVRTLSAIGLLIILFVYCSSGAFYVPYYKYEFAKPMASICIVISLLIVSFAIVELSWSNKIKEWYLILLFLILGWILVLFPISDSVNNFIFFSTIGVGWAKTYMFSVVLTIVILILFVTVGLKKGFEESILFVILFIIVTLAFKGFYITSLRLGEQVDGNQFSYYSFNTNLWVWLIAILSDTFAYIGGSKFGKRKLAPSISPNKSWEGAIIGTAVAFAFGLSYSLGFYYSTPTRSLAPFRTHMIYLGTTWRVVTSYVLLTTGFCIVSVLGDLLFSYNKRRHDIKDYSNLIPGHGGLLDRVDSVSFELFIVFVMIYFSM